MNLKQKILAAGLAAMIAGFGIFGANNATAQTDTANTNSTIAQMMAMIESLKQQIAQIIALIAQLKPQETCGNGICRFGETAATCAADCSGTACVTEGGIIQNSQTNKYCCNGLVKTNYLEPGTLCSVGAIGCHTGYICKKIQTCGNGICETGETATSCSADCAFKLFPDANSFNLTNQTFTAKEIIKGTTTEKIMTDANTKYYVRAAIDIDKYPIMEEHDFQWLYSIIKNWSGPKMNLWIKGTRQNNGSILATEISLLTQ